MKSEETCHHNEDCEPKRADGQTTTSVEETCHHNEDCGQEDGQTTASVKAGLVKKLYDLREEVKQRHRDMPLPEEIIIRRVYTDGPNWLVKVVYRDNVGGAP